MRSQYTPQKRGKRMHCLSRHRSLRIRFTRWFKEQSKQAREVIQSWKIGDWRARLPPGFFAPACFLHANLLPAYAPVT